MKYSYNVFILLLGCLFAHSQLNAQSYRTVGYSYERFNADGEMILKDSFKYSFTGTNNWTPLYGEDYAPFQIPKMLDAYAGIYRTQDTLTNGYILPVLEYHLYDSMRKYSLDLDGDNYELISRYIGVKDESGHVLETTSIGLADGVWKNVSRELYTYSGNQIVGKTSQKWEDDWVNYMKYDLTYNESGKLTKVWIQKWEDDAWKDQNAHLHEYDEDGNHIQTIVQNELEGEMENFTKTENEFNESHRKIKVTTYSWTAGAWKPVQQFTHTYTDAGNLESALTKIYSGTDWQNQTRYSFTYNETHHLEEFLQEKFVLDEWQNESKAIYHYNENFQAEYAINQSWDIGSSEWLNITKARIAYNDDQIPFKLWTEKWVDDTWKTNNISIRYTYFFDTYTETQVPDTDIVDNWLLYPNPAYDIIYLETQFKQPTDFILTIFDISGKEWRNLNSSFKCKTNLKTTGYYKSSIRIHDLPPGTYFLELNTNQGSVSRTFIKTN